MKVITPFRHERRPCACDCGRTFRPQETIGPVSTELYVNAYHAARGRALRLGHLVPALPSEDGDGRPVRPARPRQTSLAGISVHEIPRPRVLRSVPGESPDRWGLRRLAMRDLELRAGGRSRRVVLECGHETTLTIGRTWSRCRACLRNVS